MKAVEKADVMREHPAQCGTERGALLEGGTSRLMPPHAAAELAAYLTPGAYVQAWGQGVKNRFGSTIEVEEIAYLVDEASSP